MSKIFYLLFLLLPFLSHGTDLKPWFRNDCEFEARSDLLYQNYNSVSIPHHRNFKRNENDEFITLSVIYPFKRYCGEFEVTAAHTRHQKYGWDNFRITGRYQWLDDTDGDPFSLVTGITLGEPYSRALHDISSFHHGHVEGELHVSFGKEYGYPCNKNYLFRWWNVTGVGVAEEGSPWVREDFAIEYNHDNRQQIRAFMNTLWGKGKKNLRIHHFKGYGSINHKSVDLGIRYGLSLGCLGTLGLQYARRVYAYNFPQNVNLVLFQYDFTFGTQFSTSY